MWITKLVIPYRENALMSNLAKKHKVRIVGYPINHSTKKDCVEIIGSCYFHGNKKNINKLISDVRKDKRLLNIELEGNFAVANIKQHLANKCLFQPGLFHTKPYIIDEGGNYIFELASWDKNKLIKLIQTYKKFFQVKLIWIKQKNITNIQIINIYPNLTDRQRECLQTAIDKGYYDSPRKITLKKLSKICKLSYSTFQFHLQKAEKKIIPFLSSII